MIGVGYTVKNIAFKLVKVVGLLSFLVVGIASIINCMFN